MRVLTPTPDMLTEVFAGSKDGILITPFFSKAGIEVLDSFFENAEKCEVWTKLNVFDWQAGYADLPALCSRLDQIAKRGGVVEIFCKSDLHAKVYHAKDLAQAIYGSANLTATGFSGNSIEVITQVSGTECDPIQRWVDETRFKMGKITVEDLIAAVNVTVDAIPDVGHREMFPALTDDENFQAAVALFEDDLLGKIKTPRREGQDMQQPGFLQPGIVQVNPDENDNLPLLPEPWPDYSSFIEFCKAEGSEEADVLIRRSEGEGQLSGHIRQFFHAVLLFFFENPDVIEMIPDYKATQTVYWDGERWIDRWHLFLSSHGDDTYQNVRFSFRTVRNLLPPSCGGVTLNGGGGTGNFKRVLPLLKRMLQELGI